MVKLSKTFNSITSSRVLVAGDLMLDAYTFGKARRISPEAPVPIVHVQSEEQRPGGAGNVVLNLVSMGASVTILGRIGCDTAGKHLQRLFMEEGVSIDQIYVENSYLTPIKNRIIADTQQILRIDHETVTPLCKEAEDQILASLPSCLDNIDVIALSDYGKGFLTDRLLQTLINEANSRNIPIIADPKGLQFEKYRGVTWLKPNQSEAYAAANMAPNTPLEDVAKTLFAKTDAQWLMITRSEAGIALFNRETGREDFPVVIKAIKDVTGAGDTVLAMLTTAIANKFTPAEGCRMCNIAAGIAIEQIGCARVTLKELAQRLLESDISHKVFDHDEQIDTLEELLKHGGYQLLKVPSASGLTSTVFREIRKMKQEHTSPLMVHVQNHNHDDQMVSILADLQEVDFVISKPDRLERLMKKMPPVRIQAIK